MVNTSKCYQNLLILYYLKKILHFDSIFKHSMEKQFLNLKVLSTHQNMTQLHKINLHVCNIIKAYIEWQ